MICAGSAGIWNCADFCQTCRNSANVPHFHGKRCLNPWFAALYKAAARPSKCGAFAIKVRHFWWEKAGKIGERRDGGREREGEEREGEEREGEEREGEEREGEERERGEGKGEGERRGRRGRERRRERRMEGRGRGEGDLRHFYKCRRGTFVAFFLTRTVADIAAKMSVFTHRVQHVYPRK